MKANWRKHVRFPFEREQQVQIFENYFLYNRKRARVEQNWRLWWKRTEKYLEPSSPHFFSRIKMLVYFDEINVG